MKRFTALLLLCAMTVGMLSGCGQKYDLYVFNAGEYIDPEVITQFEEETGLRVLYDEFEANEDMYAKIRSGAVSYDVVCPSDYMIEHMIQEDLLQEIDFNNVPNIKNIGESYLKQSESFDPGNKYSVPYSWGTVGILYNKTMVDAPITSWSAIFDEKYKGSILMINSIRDALGIALKYQGHSLNSLNPEELKQATELLKQQKSLVQGYFTDQVRDKMIGGEAALGIIYSGEALYTQDQNPDLVYVVPDEGSNIWIDAWVIPKNAENKENSEKWINFLCRPDIALKNFEYITYATPNVAAQELIEDEDIRDSEVLFPGKDIMDRCETFKYLGKEGDKLYQKCWTEVKAK